MPEGSFRFCDVSLPVPLDRPTIRYIPVNLKSLDQFENDVRNVTVVADTTTDVEILLEPVKEKVIKITGTASPS